VRSWLLSRVDDQQGRRSPALDAAWAHPAAGATRTSEPARVRAIYNVRDYEDTPVTVRVEEEGGWLGGGDIEVGEAERGEVEGETSQEYGRNLITSHETAARNHRKNPALGVRTLGSAAIIAQASSTL